MASSVHAAAVVEVVVRSERFKFNAAHFVAFKGYRERLHGHNYTVGIRMLGTTSPVDGYVMDFGDVKKTVRDVCAQLNERFLCPARSDVLRIDAAGANVCMRCEDGSFFSLPKDDCAMLPIVHSTAEELAAMLWTKIIQEFGIEILRGRKITTLEVSVAESPTQEARYCQSLDAYDPAAPAVFVGPPNSGCSAFRVPDRSARTLLDRVRGHEAAAPFEAIGDLAAIQTRLDAGQYEAVDDLVTDLRRIIDHSRKFNEHGTEYGIAADTLDAFIDVLHAEGAQEADAPAR
ncbi:hypothetical protein M885DRAFT_510681 [Pelagophyceae sp. CCMP2097]|nr:hypothetical protein M885DRAFT_510681 [Pelagophyceae sp. CCMP2097]